MAVSTRSRSLWGTAAVLLLVPTGFALIWSGFSVSGCPLDAHELELLGEPTTCRSGWESEVSWLLMALGYLAFALVPVAVIATSVALVGAVRSSRKPT